MWRDPVSKPIQWLSIVSAIALTVFLYKFTTSTLNYIDRVEADSDRMDVINTAVRKENKKVRKTLDNITHVNTQVNSFWE